MGEYVAVAEARLKKADNINAQKKAFLDSAKKLKQELGTELKDTLHKWGTTLTAEPGDRLSKKALEILGADSDEHTREGMVKAIIDAASLGARGIETKLSQKLEDAVGGWASLSAKNAAKKAEL